MNTLPYPIRVSLDFGANQSCLGTACNCFLQCVMWGKRFFLSTLDYIDVIFIMK